MKDFRSVCIVAGVVAALAIAVVHADMTAHWELHADFDDRSIPGAFAECMLKQDGERLTGRCEDATLAGEVKGDAVTWRVTLGGGTHDVVVFTGMLDDDGAVVLGRFSYAGKGGGSFLALKR